MKRNVWQSIFFYLGLLLLWEILYFFGVDILKLWKSYTIPSPDHFFQRAIFLLSSFSKFMENFTRICNFCYLRNVFRALYGGSSFFWKKYKAIDSRASNTSKYLLGFFCYFMVWTFTECSYFCDCNWFYV